MYSSPKPSQANHQLLIAISKKLDKITSELVEMKKDISLIKSNAIFLTMEKQKETETDTNSKAKSSGWFFY
jgi:hypothetical protein